MEDEYGMPPDLRQYIAARPNFFPPPPRAPPAADLLPGHLGLSQSHPYEMLVFRPEDSAAAGVSSAVSNVAVGASNGGGGGCYGGFESGVGCGGGGRWPRQETLTLLEIRSVLDSRFKEANQKGPLWDEVSRIMSEEHGYQRSGKKCREKFENLYKYYKKTKEGKAGRQDGKHYRFFRQLEALYGDSNNNSSASASEAHYQPHPIGCNTSFPYDIPNKEPCPKFSDNTSLSLSNYSEPDSTSSEDIEGQNDNEPENQKRAGKMGWKAKIKDFIDLQMKNLMEKQEAWMEKMMMTIEMKEQERLVREEEWRKQDAARIEREHQFWIGERDWIEARDAALMDVLHKLTGKEFMTAADLRPENGAERSAMWLQNEHQQRGLLPENVVLEETGGKMVGGSYLIKCGKKRKENWKSGFCGGEGVYCENSDPQGVEPVMRLNDQNHTSNTGNNNDNNDNGNSVNVMSDSCFRYFIGDGYGRIME